MALSGSFQNSPVKYLTLYCEWSASQSTTGNYSDVTLSVYLKHYELYVGSRSDSTISINGTSETYTAAAINQSSNTAHTTFLKSKTVRVYHNASGGASIALSASWRFSGTYSGVSIGTITASTTVTLNNIDRSAPTINISTSSITSSSVYVSASASTTCDVWEYSKDGGSSWTQFSTSAVTSTGASIGGLSPNKSYTIKVRARKKSNQVYGTSSGSTITTLGGAVLNSVSTVTADAATATVKFNWTIYSNTFTYILDIKSGNTVLATISIPAQSAGTTDKTITLTAAQRTALLNAMTSAKSFTGTFAVTTKNGSSTIGNVSSKTATITTTEANSAPTFSDAAGFTYKDSKTATANLTGNNQLLVQSYSALAIKAYSATAKNGASISQYEATINGATVTSKTTTISCGAIDKAGVYDLTVKAVDSRGYAAVAIKKVTVVAFEKIDITDVTMRRVNEVEALSQVTLSGKIAQLLVSGENKNALTSLKYQYKKTSEDTYGNYISIPLSDITVSGTNISFHSDELVSLDADYSFNIQFMAVDKLTSDKFTATLPQGIPLVSKRRKKVGINNKNPQSALDVVGEVRMNGFYVMGLVAALDGTEDLNNLSSGGIYTQALNANASTDKHYPKAIAGFLEVITNSSGYVMQRYTAFDNSAVYTRTRYNGSWYAWKSVQLNSI